MHPGQRLITVASTWREESLFGTNPLLVSRLLKELPYDEYRVALILHPNIWASHSEFQVRAWLAEARRAGLILVPPEEGWRAAVIAADCVIADHGSVGVYAAAADRPVLLDKSARHLIDPRSGIGSLLDTAAALKPHAALEPQLRAAEQLRERTHAVATEWVSSAPGQSLHLIRDELYRIMDIAPPDTDPGLLAIGVPKIEATLPASLWTHVEQADSDLRKLSVRRWPAAVPGSNRSGGVLIVSDDELDHRLLSQADIITMAGDPPPLDESEWSAAVFGDRPGAGLTLVHRAQRATFRTRDGRVISASIEGTGREGDPSLIFAILAERFLTEIGTGASTAAEDLAALSPLTLHLGPARTVRAAFQVHRH